jgi:hypothetical protein
VEELSYRGKILLGFETVPICGKNEGRNWRFLAEKAHE